MPFFIPLNITQEQQVSVDVLFAGVTDLVVDALVELHAPVTFAGDTLFSPTGMLDLSGATNFAGDTNITVAGRLNDEANVFGALSFNGATALNVTARVVITSPVNFAGDTNLTVEGSVDEAETYGFTIFVDITDAALQGALQPNNNIRRYKARLTVDGDEVPIIRAQLQAPDDKLGTELTIVLAEPDVTLITGTALINFDIALWVSGAWQWINLLTGGKLSQRAARYVNEEGLPKDSVEIVIVDIIGDRWNRAPREQVILYDPQIIDPPTYEAIQNETIYLYDDITLPGLPRLEATEPEFVDIPDMKLKDVLDYAYVTGCGFDKVITNIADFPIEQVTFTITGGYDAGVRGFLEIFSPVVFASGNDLWIIDPDQPLPSGISAVDFVASFSASIDDSLPAHEPVNGLLVKVKNDSSLGSGDYFTERFESSTVHNPFTSVDTQRRIREYRTLANPTQVIREEVFHTRVRVLDEFFNVISDETRTDHFDALNRPTGYSMTTSLLLPDVSNPANKFLQTAITENQLIVYTVDPLNPQRDVQSRIETHIEGLILVDEDNEYADAPYKIPLIDAHKSGYITGEDGQTAIFGPIKTVIEQLMFSGDQVRYETRTTNHVSGVLDRLTVKTLPGDSRVDRSSSSSDRTKYILLTVPGSDASSRRVAEFDGTQLPYDTAIAIAQRRLNNLNNPPKELLVNMAYVNPSLRRGAVVHVQGRSGYLGNYIIKGLTILIEGIDLPNYRAAMSFGARELKSS